MYLEKIEGRLPGHEVKIKYDCDGGFDTCGQERMLKLRYAEKNFNDNGGKHICRRCFLKTKNPMKKKEVRDKIKKTCLERYGTETPMNRPELVDKRNAKFKDEEFKRQWVEKHRQTSLERYGVAHPMHLDETKERQKKTVQEKYGVDHPMQADEVKKRARKTNMERYGVENAAQAPEVRVKMAQTTLQRYGVEHYNQLPEMKDYLRENCREWLAESWANPWAKGIVRPEEWNQKQSQTMTRLLIEGKLVCSHKGSIRGYYESSKCMGKKPFFRSHLELLVHFHLSNNEDVAHYQYEPFAIPITDEHGRQRLYVPDFQVFYKSKTRPVIIECKPEYMIEKKDNPIKFNHMRAFVSENELEFEIWSEQLIHGFGNYKQILELPQVTRI
jgi:hypothetical protein